jgi:hypothetical protein
MEFHFKLRDDSKIAAASAQAPKQVGIFSRIGARNGTVSGHQRKAYDVVARESEKPSEPAKATSEDQSRRTGMRNDTRRERESILLSGDIDRAQ